MHPANRAGAVESPKCSRINGRNRENVVTAKNQFGHGRKTIKAENEKCVQRAGFRLRAALSA